MNDSLETFAFLGKIEYNALFVYEWAACSGANRECLPSADRQLLFPDSPFRSSRKEIKSFLCCIHSEDNFVVEFRR